MEEKQIKQLIDLIFKGRDSVFLVIDGFNQIGKTDFMLNIMQGAYKHGYFEDGGFILNQQIENAPFEWKFINDMQTLKQYITTWGKPVFFFFEELGKSAPRSTPWGKINLEIIKELETKRKEKMSLGACSIGDIDRRIVSPNYLDVYIRKTGLTHATLHHLQKRVTFRLHGIPPTTIKFKEFTEATFTLEPTQSSEDLLDTDTRNALAWSRKEKYTGDLSKQGFYNSIRRGVAKWYKIYRQYVNTTKQEEQPAPEVD